MKLQEIFIEDAATTNFVNCIYDNKKKLYNNMYNAILIE